jgi:hypothetical protein
MANKIPLKSGGHILIVNDLTDCPEGEKCFLQDEYEHAKRISYGHAQDPEMQRSFWETVLLKKKDPLYNLFTDFPLEVEKRTFVGADICATVINDLKGLGAKSKEERDNGTES